MGNITNRSEKSLEGVINRVVHLMDSEVRPLCAQVQEVLGTGESVG
jgi:hypothetical protein